MLASLILLIIPYFSVNVKLFFNTTIGGVYIPALKDGVLTPRVLIKMGFSSPVGGGN